MAKEAGFFAVVIVASNAFVNFYIPFLRMYATHVFVSGVVLWLYLRINYSQLVVKRSDYIALGIAIVCLLYTQGFSLVFVAVLTSYHVLIAPKNRRWIPVLLMIALSILLFSPWILVLRSALQPVGDSLSPADRLSSPPVDTVTAIRAWIDIVLNRQPVLFLFSFAGVLLGLRRQKIPRQPYLVMFVFFLIALTLVAEITSWVRVGTLRHHLAGWMTFVLFLAAGVYGLYSIRKWLAICILFWIIAGVSFQLTANWKMHLEDRLFSVTRAPVQVISRLALQA